jgi:hypothetical protein
MNWWQKWWKISCVEYIDSVEAPALHRCAKHCGRVKPCCNSRFSVRDSRTAAFGPHPLIQNKKVVENYFRFGSVTRLRGAFFRSARTTTRRRFLSTAVSWRGSAHAGCVCSRLKMSPLGPGSPIPATTSPITIHPPSPRASEAGLRRGKLGN